jgi:hypothetical protein
VFNLLIMYNINGTFYSFRSGTKHDAYKSDMSLAPELIMKTMLLLDCVKEPQTASYNFRIGMLAFVWLKIYIYKDTVVLTLPNEEGINATI